jgi:pimeloyl-ACP methyl ester carboxylesterase
LADVRERTVIVGGLRVRMWEWPGDGPPVVLLHGLLGSPAYLEPLARVLSAHHRVLVVDLPGHGGSERLRPFSFEAAADLLADAAAVEQPVVVGHSMGAALAVVWAARRPLRGVVAVSPVGMAPLSFGPARHLLPVAEQVGWALGRAAGPVAGTRLGRAFAFGWFVGMAEPEAVAPALGRTLIHGAAASARALADQVVPIERLDLREAAAAVRCPALVVWGDRDPDGVACGPPLAEALGAETRVLPGCGHMPTLERPYAFRCALRPVV